MSAWTPAEIHTILPTYFEMLAMEIRGESFVKARYKETMAAQLGTRNSKAVEYKFMNISAVLEKHGFPYIVGYKPLRNYQALLEPLVIDYIAQRDDLTQLFLNYVVRDNIEAQSNLDFSKLSVSSPPPPDISDTAVHPQSKGRQVRKYNYLEIEQRNQRLGTLGEELVYQYEKWRLYENGKSALADKIEWTAQEKGDGAGFDIRSFNIDGTDRFLEVKTTQFNERTPIYFTRNELRFSQEFATNFHLYRVFNFTSHPGLFTLQGSLDSICKPEPISFIGRF